MKKERIELILLITAAIACMMDLFCMALQIQSIQYQWLKAYYIPVFAYMMYSNARSDMEYKKAYIRQQIQASKAAEQEQFLEDYAKFVSEVHK